MVKSLLLVSYVLISGAFNALLASNGVKGFHKGPVIQFETMVHDFGTLKEGDVVNCVFKFTNNGNEPLIIEDVEQPCGCTIPSWSKEPIMPGKSGEIKVIFNSKERPGIFRKTLTITSNTTTTSKDKLLLMIKGNVLTKKQWKQANGSTKK